MAASAVTPALRVSSRRASARLSARRVLAASIKTCLARRSASPALSGLLLRLPVPKLSQLVLYMVPQVALCAQTAILARTQTRLDYSAASSVPRAVTAPICKPQVHPDVLTVRLVDTPTFLDWESASSATLVNRSTRQPPRLAAPALQENSPLSAVPPCVRCVHPAATLHWPDPSHAACVRYVRRFAANSWTQMIDSGPGWQVRSSAWSSRVQ